MPIFRCLSCSLMTTYPFAPRLNLDGTARPETVEKFRERVIASLAQLDPRDHDARADRHIWLGKHHVRVGPYWERSETSGVMQEARGSYVHGNFIATLVLALGLRRARHQRRAAAAAAQQEDPADGRRCYQAGARGPAVPGRPARRGRSAGLLP